MASDSADALYLPLNSALNEFRLLKLSRAPDSSQPSGTLEIYSLDMPRDSPNRPKFETLSYHWGDDVRSNSVLINNSSVGILDSVYGFIELAASSNNTSPPETLLWIDSICIDQSNLPERASQVQMMGRIYREAEGTVVWLGDSFDSSDIGVEFMRSLAIKRQLWRDPISKKPIMSMYAELANSRYVDDWNALTSLLLRPWFKRVWTLQEFLVAPTLVFCCGHKSVARDNFKEAIYAIYLAGRVNVRPRFDQKAFDSAWNRRRLYMWCNPKESSTRSLPLIGLMAYTSDCRATDPRDRIYSLLGLVNDEDRAVVESIDINYSKMSTVDIVYRKLVTSCIEKYKSLDIIGLAHFFKRPSTSVDTWPSWVPDWTVERSPRVIPTMGSQGRGRIGNFRPDRLWNIDDAVIYDASRGRNPEILPDDDENILHCQGFVIDKIDGLGGTNWSDCEPSSSPTNVVNKVNERAEQHMVPERPSAKFLESLGIVVSRCLMLDRSDRYLHYPSDPDFVYKELRAIFRKAIDVESKIRPFLIRFFKHNRSLMIQRVSFESIFIDVPSHADIDTESLGYHNSTVLRLDDSVILMEKRLVVTDRGHIGMAPHEAKKGDVICVLQGGSTPFVLREAAEKTYTFVGECYMDGFMNGEAFDGKLRKDKFRIR